MAMEWSRRWSSVCAGGAATVQARQFIVERVDAVDEEHVHVDVERQPR